MTTAVARRRDRIVDLRATGADSTADHKPDRTGRPDPTGRRSPADQPAPMVTRVEIDLGSGEVRRGALLGASAIVQQHGPDGWRVLSGARVRIVFSPLTGDASQETQVVTDVRGIARFAARHHESGTWSVHVDAPDATPCSAARLVVVRD